ncbi:hypothetical protein [Methylorubrum thiocyanatum]|uniref:Uncharacterized protein n=1 Tax=Methylorubrum thiocyanatum TaxID=47958 RepID=A0AA40S2V7_9HYPH|nr:hypothetical protein [Methylorubrum thiocyanatum]MBA8913443.1 hypothetical protein [Methylorubrum thiocyanatum]
MIITAFTTGSAARNMPIGERSWAAFSGFAAGICAGVAAEATVAAGDDGSTAPTGGVATDDASLPDGADVASIVSGGMAEAAGSACTSEGACITAPQARARTKVARLRRRPLPVSHGGPALKIARIIAFPSLRKSKASRALTDEKRQVTVPDANFLSAAGSEGRKTSMIRFLAGRERPRRRFNNPFRGHRAPAVPAPSLFGDDPGR